MKLKKAILIPLVVAAVLTGAVAANQDGGLFLKTATAGQTVIFQLSDFPDDADNFDGIVITALPDAQSGTLCLDTRELLVGEAVTADNIGKLTFVPAGDGEVQATFSYLPVYANGASVHSAVVGINLVPGRNQPPVASDLEITTYKNIEVAGMFKAEDPESAPLVFQVVTKPARGEVMVYDDGSFMYVPYKNKTGNDSFEYVAIDPAGNRSAAARVSVKIEKKQPDTCYADMAGNSAHYAAIRLSEEGIFVGEKLGDQYFFDPDKPVTRGEFVAMAMNALCDVEITPVTRTGFADDDLTPVWIRPYASGALKAGVINGITAADGSRIFCSANVLTRGEAAVILNNALRIADAQAAGSFSDEAAIPAWAYQAAVNVSSAGVLPVYGDNSMRLMDEVTRAQAAQMLVNAMDERARQDKGGFLSWLW